MTEEQKPEVGNEEQKPEIKMDDLLLEVDQLKSTKERLLKESKDYAIKYRTLRDEIDQKEKIALEKSDNHRALYEKSEIKNKEIALQLESMNKKMREKEYLFQIAKHAPDARDVLLVAQKLPKELVQWNDELTTFDGIEEGLKAVRKNYGFLFEEKKGVPMVNTIPSTNKTGDKTIKSMTMGEKKQALSSALETILTKGK